MGLDASCAGMKTDRRIMITPWEGTAAFEIDVGRWQRMKREERTIKECGIEALEEVQHLFNGVSSMA